MNLRKEGITAIKVYAFTWVLALVILSVVFYRFLDSFSEVLKQIGETVTNGSFLVAFHLLFIILYILFLLLRFIRRGYKKQGAKLAFKRFGLFLVLPVLIGYLGFKAVVSSNSLERYDYAWDFGAENTENQPQKNYDIDGKHRGMSVFRLGAGDHPESMKALIKDNVEWVAVVPFLYQENEQTKLLRTRRSTTQGWSRNDSIMIQKIDTLHKQGMRVHLKPHVWLGDGWRSNLQPEGDDWDTWFDVYQKEMVNYAKIAQYTGVGLFCIGTELRTVIENRPQAWSTLITEVKKVYTGKLTYAANWDDPIDKIPFWDEMDYIGIQAYFPLTDHNLPEIAAIKEGWKPHLSMLEKASEKYDKPILFTEVGYRSDASATIKPWEWGSRLGILYNKKSDRTQQYAYEALFETLWDKPWFAGCYIWQWHANTTAESLKTDVDFTPRFKPAENTIAKWYGTKGKPTIHAFD